VKNIVLYLGHLMHCLKDPFLSGDVVAFQSIRNGAIAVSLDTGTIEAVGLADELRPTYAEATVVDRRGCILFPGFVDGHIHYPQTWKIAAPGESLLTWLNVHIFPEEAKYRDLAYAQRGAQTCIHEMIAHGVTCANVFGVQFPEAVDMFFRVAERRRFRAIVGLNLSDRNIPESLRLTPEQSYELSAALIRNWHGKGKQRYAVTPRFAPTSTPEQLAVCGRLLDDFPGVFLHTHMDEDPDEIAWMASEALYPGETYFDVYKRFGLARERTILAHCDLSTAKTIQQMGRHKCGCAHCPSSNFYLGNGTTPLNRFTRRGIRVGLGSDVGAGPGFSMFKVGLDAYSGQMMRFRTDRTGAVKLSGPKILHLLTLGGARLVYADDQIGNFVPGKAADIVVIDPVRGGYLEGRLANCLSDEERLFVLLTQSTKETIKEVYIDGVLAHKGTQLVWET
jgi:guanine deaminase